jgi:cytochrome c556
VAKGNLTFVGPNTPAEQALGIEVMGVLLGTLGQTILTTAKAMPDARRTLADRRTAYNEAWQKAHDLIQSGNEYKDGANALVAGAKLLLAPDGAQASVKELTDKLTACDTKFVADVAGVSEADEAKKKKAIQDLTTQYLADREQLEADLAKAQEALRQAQSPIAPSLIAAARALESACPALDATKPGDIGQAIAAW